MTRAIDDAGMALLEEFEQGPDGGPALTPYRCPAGKLTIGFGHVLSGNEVDFLQSITPERAAEVLRSDAAGAAHAVEAMVRAPLNDNQFSALTCLVFNIGPTNFLGSTLHRILNDVGDLADVPAQFARWDKAHDGKTGQLVELAGLKRRRAAEIALWLTP